MLYKLINSAAFSYTLHSHFYCRNPEDTPLRVMIDDEKQKPAIIKLYDFTKDGTHIIDQKMGFCSVKVKSLRWTTVSLAYLLDTIRVNAYAASMP